MPGFTASNPAATASRKPRSSRAGSAVMSAVGCSSCSGMTRSTAPAWRASWLIAAPPPAKLATICAVTAGGYGETPRAVTPWLPANTSTSTRSKRGISRRCHAAIHATSSSSRPRLPGGFVNCACRSRTAAAAPASPAGNARQRARSSSIVMMQRLHERTSRKPGHARRPPGRGYGQPSRSMSRVGRRHRGRWSRRSGIRDRGSSCLLARSGHRSAAAPRDKPRWSFRRAKLVVWPSRPSMGCVAPAASSSAAPSTMKPPHSAVDRSGRGEPGHAVAETRGTGQRGGM